MAFVSVLTPAFTLNSTDPEILRNSCAGHLGLDTTAVDLFVLVPASEAPGNASEFALKLSKTELSLEAVEGLM
jgi:hypothetical protein